MRIALVTDSHLAPEVGAFNSNWVAARQAIARLGADLTVHLGDITVDGAGEPGQFQFARSMFARWPTPIRSIPGNHDLGDPPCEPGVPAEDPLRPERIEQFRAVFGADYWFIDLPAWRIVAVDSLLFGSGTAEESRQWTWLEDAIGGSAGRSVALLCHKPIYRSDPAESIAGTEYLQPAPRRRLRALLDTCRLRVIASGHLHQYRDTVQEGVRHLWVPSTAFILPDLMQERAGEKFVGFAILELEDESLRCEVVIAEGMIRNDILDHPVYDDAREARRRAGRG